MKKLTSFLITFFSILLLLAVGFIIAKPYLPKSPKTAAEMFVRPKSDMPDLTLPPIDEFYLYLDKLTESKTLDSVRDYIVNDWVPGRALILTPAHKTESPRKLIIIDREVRRTNSQGVTLLDKAPIVPRSSDDLKVGPEVILQTWTRPHDSLPYSIIVWGVEIRDSSS